MAFAVLVHSRQWGRMNIHCRAVVALIQPPRTRRHGKHNGMSAIKINDSNFRVPLERRGFNLELGHVANAD